MFDLTSILYTVAFSLGLVMLSLYITAKRLSWLLNHRIGLIGTAVILGVIVYSIGYLSNGYSDQSWLGSIISGLMALFSTGRMFVLENDIGEISKAAGSPVYMTIFSLVMIFAMFSVVMVALSFVGYRFISRVRVFFLHLFRRSNDFYIFTNLNEDSFALAKDISYAQPKCNIFFRVNHRAQEDGEKKLESRAVAENFILQMDTEKDIVASHYCLVKSFRKARIHYIICNDQLLDNARISCRMAEYLQNSPVKERVSLYVFTDYDCFEYTFDKPVFEGINLLTVDRNALASYQFFQRLQLIHCAKADVSGGKAEGTLTVAVAGFGPVTPHLYRDIATQSQFYGLKTRIVAIAKDIEDKIAPFLYSNPQIDRCIQIDTVRAALNSKDFFEYLDPKLSGIDILICCAEDQQQTLLAAKCLQKQVAKQNMRTRVCVQARSRQEAEFVLPDLKSIEIFGTDDLIRSMDVVLNGQLDAMAKAVHEFYCQSYGDATPWQRTSLYDRQSSRALALHIPAKLASIGMVLTEEPGVSAYTDFIAADPELLQNLAISEHMRWNAYLFSHGWTQMPFTGEYRPKDTVKKSHQCLMGWEELARISKAAGRDFQHLDRHLVEHIGNIVSKAGFGIKKIGRTEL